MTEFAANNTTSDTTQVSPFFANYGFNPRFDLNQTPQPDNQIESSADQFSQYMLNIHNQLQAEIARAQEIHSTNANPERVPAPNNQVDDEVWLNAKNLRTTRPSHKLDWKRLGRFTIKRIISPYAYELELSATMKLQPVFHVSLLDPVNQDPVPGQTIPPPPLIEVEGEEEYQIEEILDSSVRHKPL